MAPDDVYSSVGSGKLKLKGVKNSKVDKKKKKSKASTSFTAKARAEEGPEAADSDRHAVDDNSVVLKKLLRDEDEQMRGEERTRPSGRAGVEDGRDEVGPRAEAEVGEDAADNNQNEIVKTEAEKRYEEQRRRRLEERLKREGVKTHKERVEELNRYLSSLSEHHDMPRIGPG